VLRSLSAAETGNFLRTRRDDGQKFVDVGAARHSVPSASAALRRVDRMFDNNIAANSVNPSSYSTLRYKTSEHISYSDRAAGFTIRRKPPEYVGYALDGNGDTREQPSLKLTEFFANTSRGVNKADLSQLQIPDELYGYGWKADEDRVWTAGCRKLNCVRGSVCVPDTLRDGRPRCQCPLGTDGPRCERRTSSYVISLRKSIFIITCRKNNINR